MAFFSVKYWAKEDLEKKMIIEGFLECFALLE